MQAIEDALKAEGVSLSTRTRKIALGEKLLPFWPHEHFTRAKLIAGSLSAESELKHLWNRSSLADNRSAMTFCMTCCFENTEPWTLGMRRLTRSFRA